ncbi:unnamed protein product [Amoebophrya sp. A120]|nr:unnamed protein product [Amoebophrya sp. A120]|eukprot:GSA120T00001783001.1
MSGQHDQEQDNVERLAHEEETFVVPDEQNEEDDARLRAELEELSDLGEEDDAGLDFLDEDEMQLGVELDGDLEMGEDEDTSVFTFSKHEDAVLNCCFLNPWTFCTSGQDDQAYVVSLQKSTSSGSSASSSSTSVVAADRESSDNTTGDVDMADSTERNRNSDIKEPCVEPGQEPLELVSVAALEKHTDSVIAVARNHSRTEVCTVGYDGVTHVHKVAVDPSNRSVSATLSHTLEGPGAELEWGCWHPKGNIVLAGSADTTTWMWHGDSGHCMQVFSGHQDGVTCGGFIQGGKLIATGCKDGQVIVWAPKSGQSVDRLQVVHEQEITCLGDTNQVDVAASGLSKTQVQNLFAVGTSEGEVHLLTMLETGKGKVVKSFTPAHEGAVEVVSFQPRVAGTWQPDIFLATAALDGKVKMWNLRNFHAVHDVQAHECGGVTALKWTPGGELLISGSLDWTARVWSPHTGDCLHTFCGHQDSILALDVLLADDAGDRELDEKDKNARWKTLQVVTASDDKTAKVWRWRFSPFLL